MHGSYVRQARLQLETLEARTVPAVWFSVGTISNQAVFIIDSDNAGDHVQVKWVDNPFNTTKFTVYVKGTKVWFSQWLGSNGGKPESFLHDGYTIKANHFPAGILFRGRGGNDFFQNWTSVPVEAWGGPGEDTLYGGNGNDRLDGGDGFYRDYLYGGGGNDLLDGGDGHNYLRGGKGSDTLYGGNGNDSLYGDEGMDYLYGQNGDDYLSGGTEDNFLFGGRDNDTMIGGPGNDFLYDTLGVNQFWGDLGHDVAYFNRESRNHLHSIEEKNLFEPV